VALILRRAATLFAWRPRRMWHTSRILYVGFRT